MIQFRGVSARRSARRPRRGAVWDRGDAVVAALHCGLALGPCGLLAHRQPVTPAVGQPRLGRARLAVQS